MHQNLEESPLSDIKMDISETTTSQESLGMSSSDIEQQELAAAVVACTKAQNSIKTIELINSLNEINVSTTENTKKLNCLTATSSENTINNESFSSDNKSDEIEPPNEVNIQINELDNRKMCFNENTLKKKMRSSNHHTSNVSPRSALTLTNNHPLMLLSNNSDSDCDELEEQQHKIESVDTKYSDVPVNEPLRLANPIDKATSKPATTTTSINTTKTKTLTTNAFNTNELLDNLSPNSENNNASINNSQRKISVPNQLLSDSDSEPDVSQFQATVTSSFQAVALISNVTKYSAQPQQHAPLKPTMTRRKITLNSIDVLSDDSNDTLSNRSFDEDIDDNLISVSQSSSIFDDTGFNDIPKDDIVFNVGSGGCCSGSLDGFVQNFDADGEPSEDFQHLQLGQIPQYSAADEARDSRNWQKVILPDGRAREIDMKVIEPYKRVLSHGGYLKAGGHNAIVLFCACYLPDRSRTDYHYVMDNLFLYVVKTLDQLVTEDYVLIYLHGGSSRTNVPSFPWLKKCYQLLDRRLRKSLKNLFMVHPTFWLKSVVWMARPFLSAKFWRKLIYVRTLEELFDLVPVEKAAVPEKVKKYNAKYT